MSVFFPQNIFIFNWKLKCLKPRILWFRYLGRMPHGICNLFSSCPHSPLWCRLPSRTTSPMMHNSQGFPWYNCLPSPQVETVMQHRIFSPIRELSLYRRMKHPKNNSHEHHNGISKLKYFSFSMKKTGFWTKYFNFSPKMSNFRWKWFLLLFSSLFFTEINPIFWSTLPLTSMGVFPLMSIGYGPCPWTCWACLHLLLEWSIQWGSIYHI